MGTLRSVCCITANEKKHMLQFDVTKAFIYGDIEEDIYMNQSLGFSDGTHQACKLQMSLYGLMWHLVVRISDLVAFFLSIE